MKKYSEMELPELHKLYEELSQEYRDYQYKALNLNMSRGKPSPEQLDLSMGMMDVLNSHADLTCEDGLSAIFLRACQTEHNFGVMTAEMDRTYAELVKTEGIISQDDMAN